jgi:two-component system response regulator YesN
MYAKEAINLGVMEYLTKPVNQKVIVENIEKAIRLIDTRRENHRQDLIIKEKLETVVPVIENGFIYSILFQEHFVEDINKYRQLLDITEENGYMLAVVFGEEQEGNYMTNAVGSSVKTQTHYQFVCETLKDAFHCVVGSIMSNKIPVFVPTNQVKMDYNERVELIDKCREITHKLHNETGVNYRIGIGAIKKMHESMESYQEAIESLVTTTAKVAHVDDLPISCHYEESYPIELEKEIFSELKAGHRDECRRANEQFFGWMLEQYGEQDTNVRLKILEFILFAEQEAYLSGGMTYHFTGRTDYLPTVSGAEKNSDLKTWYLEKMDTACKNVVVKKEEHTNQIIAKSKEYINENYGKDISLDELSRKLDVSPYYFSKLFKEETGENFIEYLNTTRIEQAKNRLRNPEMSMKEIGYEVGYSDPNYFSRIFKKYVGVTPTEFREGAVR